jgi:membrane-associated phospholipid phosphatase
MSPMKIACWLPFVALAVLVSRRFLDARLALGAMELLKSSDLLLASTANIPDVLFLLVCLASVVLWCIYLRRRHEGGSDGQTRFFPVAGSAIPFAYLLKSLFKYVFGRTNTRLWLAGSVSDDFHWFQGGGDYSSFPSGHMAVFTAFCAAVWLFHPRYRSLAGGFLLVLAVALVVTDYHFLSDVIGGFYLGLVVTCFTRICLERLFALPGRAEEGKEREKHSLC